MRRRRLTAQPVQKTPLRRVAGILTILAVVALPFAGMIVAGLWADAKSGSKAGHDDPFREVDWHLLRGLDPESGERTSDVAGVAGKKVKVAGFIVPLDDDKDGTQEFLLVPSAQACIHVPPPPPNQMIMVRMAAGLSPRRTREPVWVEGQLDIVSKRSPYGSIAYEMQAEATRPYRPFDSRQ